jgi:hypothetical protein
MIIFTILCLIVIAVLLVACYTLMAVTEEMMSERKSGISILFALSMSAPKSGPANMTMMQ